MKLFQQLLVAPAALGLLSPVAVSAAELNLSSVNQYSSADQVTSINQFSDVKPTDWAYQALSNLIERYGCVAGYPSGTFKGGQAMTRYEAAALLNACLDRITEVTDELKRLLNEFEKELAVIKGRVDRLEAKVGELEANQFSTTTRLRADTRWVLGGLNYSGNATRNGQWGEFGVRNPRTGIRPFVSRADLREALTFNYDVRLNFDTSFTGKDLLRTQLRAGNFTDSGFGADPTRLSQLDAQFQENLGNPAVDGGDVVAINRLYYKFPISKSFTAVVGPRVRQDDALPVWPSVYTSDKILKFFQYAGAPGAYSQVLGGGAGLWWKQPGKTGFSFGGAYVSGNSDNGQPNGVGGRDYSVAGTVANPLMTASGGIGNEASQQSGTLQLAYTGKNWNITGAYTYNSAGVSIQGTPLTQDLLPSIYKSTVGGGRVNSWSLAGYWQPSKSGWFPSLSAGWGYNNYVYNNDVANSPLRPSYNVDSAKSQSWYVGLNWKDVFLKGNALGFAIGQPTFLTAISYNGNAKNAKEQVYDGNYAIEVFYKYQVTDNIAVTPSLFWLTRGRGELTGISTANALGNPSGGSDYGLGTFGGLIQTTFKF
jgi:hypothetical protein